MSLSIFTNVASLDAQRNLGVSQRSLAANLAHLSSGLRINDASDDAAGLGISESMRAQIRSYNQAARNANDGVSMLQVASGAMNQQAALLTRMKELATQASNGTYQSGDKTNIKAEFDQLVKEVDRIASSTKFNGTALLGSTTSSVSLQVGTTSSTTDQIAVTVGGTDSSSLKINNLDVSASTASALDAVTAAIDTLASKQATFGAAENRLMAAADNASSMSENLSAAESRIRDVDVASESAAMTRNQILVQAGTAILAQSNQLPSAALQLLGR